MVVRCCAAQDPDLRVELASAGKAIRTVIRAKATQWVYNKPCVFAVVKALQPPEGAIAYREIEDVANRSLRAVEAAARQAFEASNIITVLDRYPTLSLSVV